MLGRKTGLRVCLEQIKHFIYCMRGLRFLGFLVLAGLALAGVFAWYNYDSPQDVLADLSDYGRFVENIAEKVRFYFSQAGSWNYLILLLMGAVLTVLFIINDLFLERLFHSRKRKSFMGGGFSWFIQRTLAMILVLLEFVVLANIVVQVYANNNIVRNAKDLKEPQTILLLGTNKKLRTKEGTNVYYTYRIDAVTQLYRQGKVKRIIISGDNSKAGYNEPADMKFSLLAKGVPEHLMELDYAGFRTLDSIVRLKGHFGVRRALIVSQQFHIERALLLAWFYDIEAVGFPAEGGLTVNMAWRELLAKPKALLDVFVFNMQPKYGKTYAKASVNWQDPKDRNFAGIVLVFCLFAGLMVYLFFNE